MSPPRQVPLRTQTGLNNAMLNYTAETVASSSPNSKIVPIINLHSSSGDSSKNSNHSSIAYKDADGNLVTYTTQLQPGLSSQIDGGDTSTVFLITKKTTNQQRDLLERSAKCLQQMAKAGEIVYWMTEEELKKRRVPFWLFVIPSLTETSAIKLIKTKFRNARIYLPRAIIDAIELDLEELPSARVLISLSMRKCRVYMALETQHSDTEELRHQVVAMNGEIAQRIEEASVVVTDRANRKVLRTAYELKQPIVSIDWIKQNHIKSLDETEYYNDARTNLEVYTIKPFHGLVFFITIKDPDQRVKNLISENGGTHTTLHSSETYLVGERYNCDRYHREIDTAYIQACVDLKYYLFKTAYQKFLDQNLPKIDQTPSNEFDSDDGNVANNVENFQFRAPDTPSVIATQARVGIMKDMYARFVLTDDEAAAQPGVSTQMRDMPDQELFIERAPEPSQVLYWQDSVSDNSGRKMY